MGNCKFCGLFTQSYCAACMVYACTAHMRIHYVTQTHKTTAVSKGVQLDDSGAPIVEER